MSVLIKTMTNLPEHCYECPCHDGESGYCQADKEHRYSDHRPFWCPLVKISNDIYEDGKSDVFDKIRAEIEQTVSRYSISRERGYIGQVEWSDRLIKESEVLQIIDKYKAERSDKCGKCEYHINPDYTRCKECGVESVRDGEKAEQRIGRWIACSDRLPEAGEYVGDVAKYYLAQNEYGDMLVARYTHSGYWEQIYQLKPIDNEIVAWCELPEPYKASPTGEGSTCDDCKTPCVMYERGMRGCISQTGAESEDKE